MKVKVYEKTAKRILTRTKIPGADYAINHYSGCTHGCVYCYARFICRWRKEKDKWGEFVDVRVNAAELAAKESKGKEGYVLLCTTGDPYQPIEKKYGLTRRVIESIDSNMGVGVLTKSDLVLKDIDLFKQRGNCDVGLTITGLDEKVKNVFEPFSSSYGSRVSALKKLKKAGVSTYAFVGPILPYLTELRPLFETLSPCSDTMMFEDLNMSAAKPSIMKAVRENFPELEDRYKKVPREFWVEKEKEILSLGKEFDQPVEIFFKHLRPIFKK